MLFAAILSGSTGSSSALSTKWSRSFSGFPFIITKDQLFKTVESMLLRSSRLCELIKPDALKTKLKNPGYVFSSYTLIKVAQEDDKFPRDAIIVVNGVKRFFVMNQVDDIIIGYALSYNIYLRCRDIFSDRFFFSLYREKDFIREVGSWGPAHSIYVFDMHAVLNKVDLRDLECFVYHFLRPDRDIVRILESLIDREVVLDQTQISPKGLSLIPPLSVLISSLVHRFDGIFIPLLKSKCRPKFYYARYDFNIFVCITQGLEKSPTAYDDLFFDDIRESIEVHLSCYYGISLEVCRPGQDPVNFRNGSIYLDNENNPRVSIKNKVGFFYNKHPPPPHS